MRRLALSLALLGACSSGLRAAEDGPGTTALPVLLIPVGSRASGMGGAFTAVASDASALYYNPAGLSRLNAHEVGLTFISGLADNSLQQVAYGGPLSLSGISGNGYASIGASLLVAQNGYIDVNRTNPNGSFLSSNRLNAGTDYVASFGYSERIGLTPITGKDGVYGVNHFVGLAGKAIRSTLVEQYSANAFTADMGYLVNSPEAGLSLGLAALNVGGTLKYVEKADPLPTTLRTGIAWQGGVPSVHSLTLAADGDWLTHEKQWHADAGLEYFWLRSYGLRLGYRFHRDEPGLTAGFGLRWRSELLIDYAWALGDALNDTHRITLTWRFGAVAPGTRGRGGRPFIETEPSRDRIRPVEEENQELYPILPPDRKPRPRTEEQESGVPGWVY